jgi:hypothetical protein
VGKLFAQLHRGGPGGILEIGQAINRDGCNAIHREGNRHTKPLDTLRPKKSAVWKKPARAYQKRIRERTEMFAD